MSEESTKRQSIFIAEPILLFLVTVFGYLFLYLHEVGYCDKFEIPELLIEVNILKLVSLAFYFIIALNLLFFAVRYIKKKITAIRIAFTIFILAIVILFGFAFDLWRWPKILLLFLFLLSVFLPDFLDFMIRGEGQVFFLSKKRGESELEKQKEERLLDIIRGKPSERILLITGLLFSLSILGLPLGSLYARTQRSFMLIKSSPELVVLREYSNNLICSEFDRQKKEISGKYLILKIDKISEAEILIENENIGPLKLSKKGGEKKR